MLGPSCHDFHARDWMVSSECECVEVSPNQMKSNIAFLSRLTLFPRVFVPFFTLSSLSKLNKKEILAKIQKYSQSLPTSSIIVKLIYFRFLH